MRMQIFRVKKPSRKILKTKNCVPFEVQYYSNIILYISTTYFSIYLYFCHSDKRVYQVELKFLWLYCASVTASIIILTIEERAVALI